MRKSKFVLPSCHANIQHINSCLGCIRLTVNSCNKMVMMIWLAASHSKIGEPWPSTLTVFHSTGDKSQKFPLGIGGNQKKTGNRTL